MDIQINATAKKLLIKVPITGSIRIDLPLGCVMDKIVEQKIVETLGNLNIKGFKIGGKVKINEKSISIG